MTFEQTFLFGLIAVVFGLLIWGRVRFDLVAFGALIVSVIAGVVPADEAFMGFGNPAVVIIALVLIVSRALLSSGSVEFIARYVVSADRSLPAHIGIMSLVGAGLSAVINNVAALAILMTIDMDAAKKAKRAVSLSLMPLSFAAILGGMITMIGTPPNIVVAQIRERAVGEPFGMFDFTPVGLVCALAGIVFVATVGWRLIPVNQKSNSGSESTDTERFVAEAKVPEDSSSIGQTPRDLFELADANDVTILGIVRRGKRLAGFAASEEIRKSDFLVLEGNTKAIEAFIGAAQLSAPGQDKHGGLTGKSMTLVEAVVPHDARMIGRTAQELRLIQRRGVTLLGLSRQGKRFRERVRNLSIEAGDVVLLLGPEARIAQAVEWFGLWPIEQGRHPVIQRQKALLTVGVFLAAVAAAVMGLTTLPIALSVAVGLYAIFNIVGPREIYEAVDWPVIVLLASLIPIGVALEDSGGTLLIAQLVLDQSANLPVWAILALIMVVTMTMSDFLNNVATALVAAPISISIADALEVSPDPFLMGVAVAASCAFLTPIGHQNNTIIMGPGGYRFGDYWRMGLPLEILIICVSVPAILFFWPL